MLVAWRYSGTLKRVLYKLTSTLSEQKVFKIKLMTMKEICSEIILFDDKLVKSFLTWCGMAKLKFVSVEQHWKSQRNGQSAQYRLLYVLKKECRGKNTFAIRECVCIHIHLST